jgi:hypothetical protein
MSQPYFDISTNNGSFLVYPIRNPCTNQRSRPFVTRLGIFHFRSNSCPDKTLYIRGNKTTSQGSDIRLLFQTILSVKNFNEILLQIYVISIWLFIQRGFYYKLAEIRT